MYRLGIFVLLASVISFGQETIDFTRDIAPVFARSCIACHGPAQQMASLRLDDAASIAARAVATPGKSADSSLIQRVVSTKPGFMMPPAGPRLTAQQIAVLRAWIDGGMKAPAAAAQPNAPSKHPHWAFQPVRRPQEPQVKQRDWVRNPVDSFILAKLEANGVVPAPEASRTALIRRVSLDLTGLPPTPDEVGNFLGDKRTDAYERVIDRLLASPHYGERWARSWLDLARYADSDGYEKDLVRPYAWRYRSWVIDALNRDMPFDQFTLEQLAGDLLPNATVDQLIATGFHRNVLTNREAGVDRAEARFEQNVNRTNTVGTVWLGLTVGCAQCHNHKYDPISQREFYGLLAYVANLEENDIDAPLPGEIGPYLKTRPEYDRQREEIFREYEIPKHQAAFEARLRQSYEKPGTDLEWDFMVTEFRASVDNAVKLLLTPPEKRTRKLRDRMANFFLRRLGPDVNRDKELAAKLKEAREKLSLLDSGLAPFSEAMAIVEDGNPPRTYLAVGGDYRTKGADVDAMVPAVTGGGPVRNRAELARWLTSADNPLTARVAVNRMWNEFFGRGIVRTTEDFGTQGEKPTNPELLDWLATEFREDGWSQKRMHKLIVMSAAYRQSSALRKDLSARDPENTLVARQSRLRLPAELVRDSALRVSGLLNTSIGGRSIRPPQPAGIAELGYANSVKWVETQGPERYRRGLYIHFQRTAPYPMLTTFDAPDSTVSCTRRARSNTPLQALNLLNDPVFLEAAQGMALRALNEPRTERLERTFQLCLGRKPTAKEQERLASYLDQQIGILKQDAAAARALMPVSPDGTDLIEAAAWVGVSRVLLNTDEFITRE